MALSEICYNVRVFRQNGVVIFDPPNHRVSVYDTDIL